LWHDCLLRWKKLMASPVSETLCRTGSIAICRSAQKFRSGTAMKGTQGKLRRDPTEKWCGSGLSI